jgi:hypothetical protein
MIKHALQARLMIKNLKGHFQEIVLIFQNKDVHLICFKEEINFTSFATVLIMAAFRLYNVCSMEVGLGSLIKLFYN